MIALVLWMQTQVLPAVAGVDVKGWASILVPSAITLGGWAWAGNRLVKSVDSYGSKQDAHEILDNTRFENQRKSFETHANLVQAKMGEAVEKFEDVRVDFAALKASLEARMPERRDVQRPPTVD